MLATGTIADSLSMTRAVHAQLEEAMRRGYVAAFRLLGNADESHEACQEAAARALSAGDRYDPALPFYPWFYRILKNHCLDRLRGRRRSVSADSVLEGAANGAVAGRLTPGSAESAVLQTERAQATARAIAELPDDLREIIELRHFQDLSYEEMAAVLECPTGTVMSRLYRARKRLRAKLLEDPAFSPDSSPGAAPGAPSRKEVTP